MATHHNATGDVIEALEQLHSRTLATATLSDEGYRLTRLNSQVEAAQNLDTGTHGVREARLSELHLTVIVRILQVHNKYSRILVKQ